MKLDKVLCPCKKVMAKEVLQAVAKGATDYRSVKKETGAGSKCGKCKKDIEKFLKKLEQDEL